MLNVLFLNPPFLKNYSRIQRSPGVTKSGTIYYPYWLCSAAGVIQNKHNIKIIDATPHNLSLQQVKEQLLNFIPDIIIIETSTPSIYNDLKVAKQLKEWYPNSIIAFVGLHVSALPEETLKIVDAVDVVMRGEYDYIVRDFVDAVENNLDWQNILGISFRRNGKIFHNAPAPLIENLDELPFLSKIYKNFLNIKDYYFAAADYPMVMMITGRGCPFKCFYCVYPQVMHGRKYRFRSALNVVEEFKYIKENIQEVKEIVIEDDTFTANPKRVREICELLIKEKIRLKWSCNARANLDKETMKLMKEAGCRLLIVGYESGVQEILYNMNKNLKLEDAIEFTKNAHKAGLLIHGCFMLGNPGETKETIKKTYEFAKKLKCDSTQFYPLFIYPGTEAYQWALKNNYISTTDYSKWLNPKGRHNCVIDLPDLKGDEITKISEVLTFKYHIRASYFIYKFFQIFKNPREFLRTLRSGLKYFKQLLVNFLFIIKK